MRDIQPQDPFQPPSAEEGVFRLRHSCCLAVGCSGICRAERDAQCNGCRNTRPRGDNSRRPHAPAAHPSERLSTHRRRRRGHVRDDSTWNRSASSASRRPTPRSSSRWVPATGSSVGTDFDDYPPEAADLPDVVQRSRRPDGADRRSRARPRPRRRQQLHAAARHRAAARPGHPGRWSSTRRPFDERAGRHQLVGEAIGWRPGGRRRGRRACGSRIDEVTSAVADLDNRASFYEIGYGPEIYGPAPDSFVADMVALAGGEPITTGDPVVFSIPLEQLVEPGPRGHRARRRGVRPVCPDCVADRPGWDAMTAVRDGAVRPVDDTHRHAPGPRLGEGLAALALAIHPDAEIEPSPAATELCARVTAAMNVGAAATRRRPPVRRGSRGCDTVPLLLALVGLGLLLVASWLGVALGTCHRRSGTRSRSSRTGCSAGRPRQPGRNRPRRSSSSCACRACSRRWPSAPACRWPASRSRACLRNPLADPYVLGTASGAALGAAIGAAPAHPVRAARALGLRPPLRVRRRAARGRRRLPRVATGRAAAR